MFLQAIGLLKTDFEAKMCCPPESQGYARAVHFQLQADYLDAQPNQLDLCLPCL